MDEEEALRLVDEWVYGTTKKRLNDLHRVIFRGSWQGKTYKEILRDLPPDRYRLEYLMQDAGYELWNLLSDVLGERVSKKNLQGAIARAIEQRAIVGDQTSAMISAEVAPANPPANFWAAIHTRQDLGTFPDVSRFYGRVRELDQLEQKIKFDRCRLFTLFGVGKVGKTSLAVKLAQRIREDFEWLIWRPLDRAPSIQALVADLIQVLSNQQDSSTDPSHLLNYLVRYPCLIVLDGFESVLQAGVWDGAYCENFEEYGELLRQVGGDARSRSCLLLTSREKPKNVEVLEGETRHVSSLKLEGLGDLAGTEIFSAQGISSASDSDLRLLIQRYSGNPFALNLVATVIRRVFSGDVVSFLAQQDRVIYREIRDLCDRQFDRLSRLEKSILFGLANHAEPATFTEILQFVIQPASGLQLQEALLCLWRRSLVEVNSGHYFLQSLFQAYMTELDSGGDQLRKIL